MPNTSPSRREVCSLFLKATVGLAALPVTGCRFGNRPAVRTLPKPNVLTSSGDSTREMAELLQSIARATDPRDLEFLLNEERARLLYAEMMSIQDLNRQGEIRLRYAVELINAGKSEAGIDALAALEQELKSSDPEIWKRVKKSVLTWQAIGNLRLGEQQNCCAANTPQSCLLPIRGAGVHTRPAGSTHAIQIYEEILRENPEDLQARWLLNIAAMTLGKYPEGVPEKWRISPQVFQSEYTITPFPNVAPVVGINLLGRSGGVVVDDLDGDGHLDILVSAIGFQDQLRFFHNNGDGTFTERTKEAGLVGEMGGLNMIQGDYNNDGHPDVFLLRGGWMGKAGRFPSSLLRNNGDGTFTDVTREAGVFRIGPTQTAVWFDYDNDGLLDLFVAYESGAAGSFPCALFHNNGDGTFTDVAHQAGVDFVGYVKAVVSADYDNDGWPDLLLTQGGQVGGKCVLFHNNGNGTFTDVAAAAGITEPSHSFSAFFFDYDNDGWQDLFVIGFKIEGVEDVAADYLGLPTTAERSHLYHNNGNGTFTDVSREAHLDRVILGMGINYGDLDNDGWLDFYVGTGNPQLSTVIPNRMFRNAEGKYFQEVTTSGNFGHLQKGHAIAFADINNDGCQDIFAQMGGANYGDTAYSALFANPGSGNHWITLKLEGVKTNRSAIGARIKVTVKTSGGTRDIYKTVSSGGSFGASPLRQEIGLGRADGIEQVAIYWPVSRKTQTLHGLALDRFYSIREDQDQAVLMNLKTFAWPEIKTPANISARK